MTEQIPKPMPVKYAMGWWAALIILWGPSRVDYQREHPFNLLGFLISLIIVTAVAYGLARLGWHRGWFRKSR